MYNIIQLNDKSLSELQSIAQELGIKKTESLKKEELVYSKEKFIKDELAYKGDLDYIQYLFDEVKETYATDGLFDSEDEGFNDREDRCSLDFSKVLGSQLVNHDTGFESDIPTREESKNVNRLGGFATLSGDFIKVTLDDVGEIAQTHDEGIVILHPCHGIVDHILEAVHVVGDKEHDILTFLTVKEIDNTFEKVVIVSCHDGCIRPTNVVSHLRHVVILVSKVFSDGNPPLKSLYCVHSLPPNYCKKESSVSPS